MPICIFIHKGQKDRLICASFTPHYVNSNNTAVVSCDSQISLADVTSEGFDQNVFTLFEITCAAKAAAFAEGLRLCYIGSFCEFRTNAHRHKIICLYRIRRIGKLERNKDVQNK